MVLPHVQAHGPTFLTSLCEERVGSELCSLIFIHLVEDVDRLLSLWKLCFENSSYNHPMQLFLI